MCIVRCTYRNTDSQQTVNPFRVILILIFLTNTNNDAQYTGGSRGGGGVGGGGGRPVGGVYSSDGAEVWIYFIHKHTTMPSAIWIGQI